MKKRFLILLLVSLCLVSCSPQSEAETTVPPASLEESLAVAHLARAAAEERAAYYERQLAELQAEFLQAKADFSIAKSEYLARIEELEAAGQPNGGGSSASFPFRVGSSGGGAIILSYIGNNSSVTVPEKTPDGIPILAIGDYAFENKTNLTSVTLPKGIRSIGWFAYSGCVSLKEIHIPASVESIGYGAFLNCPQSLRILCPAGSYPEAYAQSYGFAVS